MDFRDRHVVVTGGAGALGTAVVAALVEAGAICHVPCLDEAEAQRFRLREHKQVSLTVTGNLAEEAAIERLYQGITPLWASIHIAGGFAAGPLRDTELGDDAAADRHELRQLHRCAAALPCGRWRAAAAASSMSPRGRRWNGAAAPA